MSTEQKERAGLAAAQLVRDGMVVGLGTGSTAAFFVKGVGARVREEGLDIKGIPTAEETGALAQAEGIELIEPDETTVVDLCVDGADEIDARGHLIKGGGAALLREKIVGAAAKRYVIIADESKAVQTLGAFPLPIEIEPFSYGLTVRAIRDALAEAGFADVEMALRPNAERNGFLLTDGGNLVLDAKLGRIEDPAATERLLNMIPGVVDCGLFVDMAEEVILGTADGVDHRTL